MINSDLILTEAGDILYLQDQPYARAIGRVEFYVDQGYMIIIYDNEDSFMVECEITRADLKQAIRTVPSMILSWIKDGDIQDGYEVPLVAIR